MERWSGRVDGTSGGGPGSTGIPPAAVAGTVVVRASGRLWIAGGAVSGSRGVPAQRLFEERHAGVGPRAVIPSASTRTILHNLRALRERWEWPVPHAA